MGLAVRAGDQRYRRRQLRTDAAHGYDGNITPATLTYTANSTTAMVGQVRRGTLNLSGSVSGFVGGDTLANATTGSALWNALVTNPKPGNSYAIDGSGLTANNGNYVFVQAASNATALTILGGHGGAHAGGSFGGGSGWSQHGETPAFVAGITGSSAGTPPGRDDTAPGLSGLVGHSGSAPGHRK